MSPSVLEEGTARRRARREQARRARRRRRLATLATLLALAGVTLALVLTGGPLHAPARAPLAPRASGAAHTPAPVKSLRTANAYGSVPAAREVSVKLRLGLRSGLLFDVHTGQVLWQRDPDRILPIASLTKMMTALVVADRSRPGEPVLITRAATRFSGSGVGLLPLHKHVRVETLLYGLLLPSGNDAAIALAQHVAGTQSRFVELMNRTAARMHLTCTHFTSVSGIVDRGNHSCAGDLAVLAHAVLTNRRLARIVGSASAVLPFPIKGGKLYLYNNNPLLLDGYPGTDGVKTGYTEAAGPCLVATARRGRAWFGVVLLHSADARDQAQALLDAAFGTLRPRRSRRTRG